MGLKGILCFAVLLAVGLCCLGLASDVAYAPPGLPEDYFFAESFDRGTLDGWVISSAKKADSGDTSYTKYDGKWEVEEMKATKLPGDKGLVLKTKAAHGAISAKLRRPFVFAERPLVVQYEVNFQNGIECGGAYVKLLTQSEDLDLGGFTDGTPYTIMFGPDKCGEDYKLHFIFKHKNPKTGVFEEKHAKKSAKDIRSYFTDKKTHLYTLVLNPDNSFEILVDQEVVKSGSLLTDMAPGVNEPAEIPDPDDSKPTDWDDRRKIRDSDAAKPEDWDEDEPKEIPDEDAAMPDGWLDDQPDGIDDPKAEKPEDWDDEMDGEWEAPEIDNPACEGAPGCGPWKPPMLPNPRYKGKWKAPKIDNPDYQGEWRPRTIPNPDYLEDLEPFKMSPIGAVGLELWSMSSDIFFDNFLIVADRDAADQWAADGWRLKKAAEGAAADPVPAPAGPGKVDVEERDWPPARYVLVVALPFVLFSVVYVSRRKTTTAAAADAAEYKKTDEPQPDVKEEEEEEEEDKKEEIKKEEKEAVMYHQSYK